MPSDRAPQNSAISSHHSRLLSDLHSVYCKIIHTAGPDTSLRSQRSILNSRNSLQTGHSPWSTKAQRLAKGLCKTDVSEASLSSSAAVEEIVIKPLQICERKESMPRAMTSQSNRSTALALVRYDNLHSNRSSTAPSTGRVGTEQTSGSPVHMSVAACSSMATPASSSDHYSSTYSEQSIRFVAEQVALEKARGLKRLGNIIQHRVDRKYFVSGISMSNIMSNTKTVGKKSAPRSGSTNATLLTQSTNHLGPISNIRVALRDQNKALVVDGKRSSLPEKPIPCKHVWKDSSDWQPSSIAIPTSRSTIHAADNDAVQSSSATDGEQLKLRELFESKSAAENETPGAAVDHGEDDVADEKASNRGVHSVTFRRNKLESLP